MLTFESLNSRLKGLAHPVSRAIKKKKGRATPEGSKEIDQLSTPDLASLTKVCRGFS